MDLPFRLPRQQCHNGRHSDRPYTHGNRATIAKLWPTGKRSCDAERCCYDEDITRIASYWLRSEKQSMPLTTCNYNIWWTSRSLLCHKVICLSDKAKTSRNYSLLEIQQLHWKSLKRRIQWCYVFFCCHFLWIYFWYFSKNEPIKKHKTWVDASFSPARITRSQETLGSACWDRLFWSSDH